MITYNGNTNSLQSLTMMEALAGVDSAVQSKIMSVVEAILRSKDVREWLRKGNNTSLLNLTIGKPVISISTVALPAGEKSEAPKHTQGTSNPDVISDNVYVEWYLTPEKERVALSASHLDTMLQSLSLRTLNSLYSFRNPRRDYSIIPLFAELKRESFLKESKSQGSKAYLHLTIKDNLQDKDIAGKVQGSTGYFQLFKTDFLRWNDASYLTGVSDDALLDFWRYFSNLPMVVQILARVLYGAFGAREMQVPRTTTLTWTGSSGFDILQLKPSQTFYAQAFMGARHRWRNSISTLEKGRKRTMAQEIAIPNSVLRLASPVYMKKRNAKEINYFLQAVCAGPYITPDLDQLCSDLIAQLAESMLKSEISETILAALKSSSDLSAIVNRAPEPARKDEFLAAIESSFSLDMGDIGNIRSTTISFNFK